MQNMIGKDFESLPQRGIYYYLATYPQFQAVQSQDASAEDQEAANSFIKGIYTRAFDDPSLLGLKPEPDDCLEDHEPSGDRPKLAPKIRNALVKAEAFVELLYQLSLHGEPSGDSLMVTGDKAKLKPSQAKQLTAFGAKPEATGDLLSVAFPAGVARGLVLLAGISADNASPGQKPYLLFSRGVFDPAVPWVHEVFSSLMQQSGPYKELIGWLQAQGYLLVTNRPQETRATFVSLDYSKDYVGTGEPLKWAWSERNHGGIEVVYQETQRQQLLVSLRIPYFAELLRQSEAMPEEVSGFIQKTAKRCDACRYCVQTDKTGKRPLKSIKLGRAKVCPLFAGFRFRWHEVDSHLAADLIAMLGYIDTVFASGGAGEEAIKRWAR